MITKYVRRSVCSVGGSETLNQSYKFPLSENFARHWWQVWATSRRHAFPKLGAYLQDMRQRFRRGVNSVYKLFRSEYLNEEKHFEHTKTNIKKFKIFREAPIVLFNSKLVRYAHVGHMIT